MIRTSIKRRGDMHGDSFSENEMLDENTINSLKNLISDKNFSRHQKTLQKTYQFVIDSADNDRKWFNKCQALQEIIQSNQSKVEAAKLLGKEDRLIIDSLKGELEKAWQTIDQACENEKKARESKAYIERKLEKLQANSPATGDSKTGRANERLREENQDLLARLSRYESKLTQLKTYQLKSEEEIVVLKKQLEKKSRAAESTKEKLATEIKKKGDLEKETKKLKSALEITKSQTPEKNDSQLTTISKLQKQLAGKTKALEKVQVQLESSMNENSELQESFKYHEKLIEALAEEKEKENTVCALQCAHSELGKVKKELEGMMVSYDKLLEKNAKADTKGSDKHLAEKNSHLKKQLDEIFERYRKTTMTHDELKRKNEELIKECNRFQMAEKELLNVNQGLLDSLREEKKRKGDFENLKSPPEVEIESLKAHISQLSSELEKHLTLIEQLEKGRDKYMSTISNQEQTICSLKLQIASFECVNFPKKLKDIQKKLEAAENEIQAKTGRSTVYENTLKKELDVLNCKLDMKERENLRLHQFLANQNAGFAETLKKTGRSDSPCVKDNLDYKDLVKASEQMIDELEMELRALKEDKTNLSESIDLLLSERALLLQRNELQHCVIERGQRQHELQTLRICELEKIVAELHENIKELQKKDITCFQTANKHRNSAKTVCVKNKHIKDSTSISTSESSSDIDEIIKQERTYRYKHDGNERRLSKSQSRTKPKRHLKAKGLISHAELNDNQSNMSEANKPSSSKRETARFHEWYEKAFRDHLLKENDQSTE